MHKFDYLVLGSGIAGLTFALKACKNGTVCVLTKKEAADSSTNNAQGGIASVFDKSDSFDLHIKDTLDAGAGLCNENRVRLMVEEGPDAILDLVNWGAEFTGFAKENGNVTFDLGREGGHGKHRIIHAKDLTGREIERALLSAAGNEKNITLLTGYSCVELLTEHHLGAEKGSTCYGVYAYSAQKRKVEIFNAAITVLATGGAGRVYKHTTNPDIATGDGVAVAHRAGAQVANMEFMQFHPTTLFHPRAGSFLITEALRGFGAVLKNEAGEDFVRPFHPMGSLAPRDIVARAIDLELKKKGLNYVYLDATHLDKDALRHKFPYIYATCLEYGINMTREPIPVVPAAHYLCGGVVVDEWSRASGLERLYACGEVSHTGVHGANRLASNSLLEAVVFGKRAAEDSAKRLKSIEGKVPVFPVWDDSGTDDPKLRIELVHDRAEIQTIMWDYVGIVRSDLLLRRAMRRLEAISQELEEYYKKTKINEELLEVRNLAKVARLVVKCALSRHESRGLNYNIDYPEKNDKDFCCDTVV
ncbi:MAG: L-aspartate oxidase [Fibrobacteres bacterium]|nr:L-aspartate oxidase [Fibrobacterota bacterium]